MELLKTILLSLDFSASTDQLLNAAVELGKAFNSSITPMHVLPDDIENPKVKSLLQNAAQEKLETVVEKIEGMGLQAGSPILEYGSAHEDVVQAATGIHANLVVIGSGEHLRAEKFQLGMTAERIIQGSEKPVFVVKEGRPLDIQQILCPVDFSGTSKRALKNAITMAHKFKAALTVLSVMEPKGSTWLKSEKVKEEEHKQKREEFEAKLDGFLKSFNLGGLKWAKEIREGGPAEEILKDISEKRIDLLVMGTQGRTGLSKFMMGSVTEKVIREVPCSFVTLKSEDFIELQLESSIRDIESHYDTAMQLMEDGFYEEAIGQLKICMNINNMYIPAYFGMAKVYDKMEDPEKAELYRKQGRHSMNQMWYSKIEDEVRKLRSN